MRYIAHIIIFLGFLFFPVVVSAQIDTIRNRTEKNKSRFEQIMENETERKQSTDTNNLHQYYLIAEELPNWFFNPSDYTNAPVFFIGISEPGMDSVKASNLAVLRAKSLATLSTGTEINNVSDNFQVARETGRDYNEDSHYLDFSRLHDSSLVDSTDFKVNKIFYTKYKEAIALVSYTPNEQGCDTLSVDGEIMQLAREDSYDIENTVVCSMDIDFSPYDTICEGTEKNHFLLKGLDERFNIISVYNEDTIEFPFHPYNYVEAGETKKDSTLNLLSNPANLGLWNAFVNLVFSNVNYFNRNLESKVKTSQDNYNLKNQGIIRTVSQNRIRFGIDSIALRNNELFLKLELDTF
ncbi:MAG: hypothetical protein K9H65_01625 [Bacteroidales bacterium]|nr:hypothetical protein [Bacteroidales bacterium]